MISLLTSLLLHAPLASAQSAHLPNNIRFADVCRYGVADARLTCRDQRGNKLIDAVRVYDRQWLVGYDELMVIALMRGHGFDLGPRVTYKGDKVSLYFYRTGAVRAAP